MPIDDQRYDDMGQDFGEARHKQRPCEGGPFNAPVEPPLRYIPGLADVPGCRVMPPAPGQTCPTCQRKMPYSTASIEGLQTLPLTEDGITDALREIEAGLRQILAAPEANGMDLYLAVTGNPIDMLGQKLPRKHFLVGPLPKAERHMDG